MFLSICPGLTTLVIRNSGGALGDNSLRTCLLSTFYKLLVNFGTECPAKSSIPFAPFIVCTNRSRLYRDTVEVSILTCEIIDGRSWSSDATIPASVIPRCFVNERVGDISAPDTSSEPLISVEGLTKIGAVIPEILSNFRRAPTLPLVRHVTMPHLIIEISELTQLIAGYSLLFGNKRSLVSLACTC